MMTGSIKPTAQDENYVTESYLRRGIEVDHALRLVSIILFDLGFHHGSLPGALYGEHWYKEGIVHTTQQHYWSYNHGHYLYKPWITYTITDRFYRPGGEVNRGDPVGVSSVPGTTGQYTTIRNTGLHDLTHQVDKTVTLEHSRSSTLSKGLTLDLTAKAEASYGGVSASLESHLGVTVNKEDSESTTTTTSTTFSDTVTVEGSQSTPGGEQVAIVYSKTTKRFNQPFSINAIADFGFKIEFYDLHYAPRNKKNALYLVSHHNNALWESGTDKNKMLYVTSFKSLHDFAGFIRGYDPRAPQMRYYPGNMSKAAMNALETLEKAEVLRLQLTGTQDVVQEGDADYTVTDIKGVGDDKLADLFGVSGKPIPESI